MFTFWSLTRVKACVRVVSSACSEDVSWECGWFDEARGITLSGCSWTIVYPAPNGASFWELPSMNQDGTAGSVIGWLVICSKGLGDISKFWTQSWDRCSASGSGVGNKLTGLRGFTSVQFSCSVVFDSLWPHESQHARPPCPSATPRFYPNSCPSSW